ncbi:MAG: hypothetical protein RSA73_04160 [Anaerovoracaceae bacterium]
MKKSYFNISWPLIRENLRRFWLLPVIAFFAYFICGIFPFLMSHQDVVISTTFINNLLTHGNMLYNAINLILPVFTATLVFKYLFHTDSTTMIHALPFNRFTLFNSNLVSGFILTVLPIIFSGIILLCMANPTMLSNSEAIGTNIFTYEAVYTWLWQSLLLLFLVYVIAVFAGMFAGNMIMFVILAIGFNIILLGLRILFIMYFNQFLPGYSDSVVFPMGAWLSPYINILYKHGSLSSFTVIVYLIVALVLIIIAACLYSRRKPENAGDSLIFKVTHPIVTLLFTFFGMTGIGFGLYSIISPENNWVLYIGFAIGTVISFVIVSAAIKKTFRIFDKKAIISFIAYSVVATCFVLALTMDITGFGNKLPNLNKVDHASTTVPSYLKAQFDPDFYKSPSPANGEWTCYDPASIGLIKELHADSIKEDKPNSACISGNSLKVSYFNEKDHGKMQRQYNVTEDFVKSNPNVKALMRSKEFNKFFSPKNIKLSRKHEIKLTDVINQTTDTISPEKEKGLLNALDQDFQMASFEEKIQDSGLYGKVAVDNIITPKANNLYFDEPTELQIDIKNSDKHTIKWLKDNGYNKKITTSANAVNSIDVEYISQSGEYIMLGNISNKKQIEEILKTGHIYSYIGNNKTQCTVNFNGVDKEKPYFFHYANDELPPFLKALYVKKGINLTSSGKAKEN